MTRRALAAQSLAVLAAAQPSGAKPVLVFDVNETLLDIRALEPHFEKAFGSALVMREWFSTLLLYSMTVTLGGIYKTFGEVAGAALDMTARSRNATLTAEDRAAILATITKLPAHPEVAESLTRLKQAEFRMVTLTNSAPAAVKAQMESSGLTKYFEKLLSVDAVKKFKPAPEPYREAGRVVGVPTSGLCMVAAHAWDIAGAMAAGCTAAFIARPGKVLFPLAPAPRFTGPDLTSVAAQLIAAYAK